MTARPGAGKPLAPERPFWQEQAVCRGKPGWTALFYAEGVGRDAQEARAWAKRICAVCPVREECRAFAVKNKERFGIWGGVFITESQKRRGRYRRKDGEATQANSIQ